MRLWTLHPAHLDAQGLVALWREGLLARAVLRGRTAGYRHHPQLQRFQRHPNPVSVLNGYLAGVWNEATARGYSFDRQKIGPLRACAALVTTTGQLAYEWGHLLAKLQRRSPDLYERVRGGTPRAHPCFEIVPGPVEPWEKQR